MVRVGRDLKDHLVPTPVPGNYREGRKWAETFQHPLILIYLLVL